MRVLVTGGAGYIGSHTVRELLDIGHEVTVFDNLHVGDGRNLLSLMGRKGVNVVLGDISNFDEIDRAIQGHDKVVHLAAIVGEPACDKNEEIAASVNIDGTKNVFHACKNSGIKQLVFLSTASSYGVQDSSIIADEDTPTNPISFYAKTKLDMEEFLLNQPGNGPSVTIFRPSTVYGLSGRMRFDLIANTMTKTCFLSQQLELFALDLWRPIFWVGDAGRAICEVLMADESVVNNRIFNCGNNSENYQIRDIGEKVASVFSKVQISYDERIHDARSYKVDFSRLENEVGFKVSKTLEQAVEEMKVALETRIVGDPNSPSYYNHRTDEVES